MISPVLASAAHTLSGVVKYSLPSTMSGVDLIPTDCGCKIHFSDNLCTFVCLICASALKRRPD
jgi:hypothetical protein